VCPGGHCNWRWGQEGTQAVSGGGTGLGSGPRVLNHVQGQRVLRNEAETWGAGDFFPKEANGKLSC
jgi:glucokinase